MSYLKNSDHYLPTIGFHGKEWNETNQLEIFSGQDMQINHKPSRYHPLLSKILGRLYKFCHDKVDSVLNRILGSEIPKHSHIAHIKLQFLKLCSTTFRTQLSSSLTEFCITVFWQVPRWLSGRLSGRMSNHHAMARLAWSPVRYCVDRYSLHPCVDKVVSPLGNFN